MKVKIEEVQKQQAEYRITAEKYGGGIGIMSGPSTMLSER